MVRFLFDLFPIHHKSQIAENYELQVLKGNNQFTNNLYKVLAEEDGNIFLSPISIHVVLSMAYQGAQGTTAQQFADTLQVSQAKLAAKGYKIVMKRLNSVKKLTLLMANRVYLMSGNTLLKNFKTAITKHFLSNVQLVDFRQNEVTAKIINDWVKKQTREKIQDIITKDDLAGLTGLVLVNAIYFKGNWKYPFEKSVTKTEAFYLNDNDKTDVQMMHITGDFNYKNDQSLEAQILELPYKNKHLSMIIILPHERNGINKVERKLCDVNLTDLTREMVEREVNVSLPRFKLEATIELKNSLTKIGLGEIFDENNANFQGMLENPGGNLYVSKVIQKSFIEVNEEGAEAAAATAISMAAYCSSRDDEDFTVDHPFIFILAEKRNNQLFIGRIANPNNV